MAAEIHLGDVGTVFQITFLEEGLIVDLSGATTKQIIFKKTNGILVTKSAEFLTDGTDGRIIYISQTGDLDLKGVWKIQGYVELPTGKWHTDIQTFTVYENL